MSAKVTDVVAAIIERGGRLLMARRLDGTHLAGLWEFPGGKVEPGETHEGSLQRELREELGVESTIGPEVLATTHAYPDRTLRLHFRKCEIQGEPKPLLGQELRWVTRAELAQLEVPEADLDVVKLLTASGR